MKNLMIGIVVVAILMVIIEVLDIEFSFCAGLAFIGIFITFMAWLADWGLKHD